MPEVTAVEPKIQNAGLFLEILGSYLGKVFFVPPRDF
jgi:hypothetical protein